MLVQRVSEGPPHQFHRHAPFGEVGVVGDEACGMPAVLPACSPLPHLADEQHGEYVIQLPPVRRCPVEKVVERVLSSLHLDVKPRVKPRFLVSVQPADFEKRHENQHQQLVYALV